MLCSRRSDLGCVLFAGFCNDLSSCLLLLFRDCQGLHARHELIPNFGRTARSFAVWCKPRAIGSRYAFVRTLWLIIHEPIDPFEIPPTGFCRSLNLVGSPSLHCRQSNLASLSTPDQLLPRQCARDCLLDQSRGSPLFQWRVVRRSRSTCFRPGFVDQPRTRCAGAAARQSRGQRTTNRPTLPTVSSRQRRLRPPSRATTRARPSR